MCKDGRKWLPPRRLLQRRPKLLQGEPLRNYLEDGADEKEEVELRTVAGDGSSSFVRSSSFSVAAGPASIEDATCDRSRIASLARCGTGAAPAAAACNILLLEIFDPFMPAFRSYSGISQNACIQTLDCPAIGQ